MKNKLLKIKYLVLIPTALLISLLWVPKAFASGNFYMTGGSVQVGQTITVSLRIDPGTSINAVQATINYDSSMLQYDSYSLGVFNICGQQPSAGNLTFGCAMSGSTSSDSLVGTFTFTALVGSGSTNLSISNDSAAYNGANVSVSASGSTVDFTSPAPAPTPTPTPTPAPAPTRTYSTYNTQSYAASSPAATPASTPTPAATPASTPLPKVKLQLDGLKASFTGAKVSVTVNHPVAIFFEYGPSTSYLPHLTHPIDISNKALVSFGGVSLSPATTYYYKLVAQINGTTVASSPIQKFTTEGLTISVAVLDGHYHPISHQQVVLHTKAYPAVTNSLGVATFYNVAPGIHHLEYSIDGQNFSQVVYVTNDIVRIKGGNESATPQAASVIFHSYYQSANNLAKWAYPAITLLIVTAVFLISGPRNLAHRTIRLIARARAKL